MKPDTLIRVLIAEDEPIILNNIAKKAAKAGGWVQIAGLAESGSEALSLLEKTEADILITDIEMPGMNGLELIRSVREQYPHIKIIILSGYSNFEYARTALRYGVNDYLLKPVTQDIITTLLHKLGEQIAGEAAARRREILSLALNGNSLPDELPSSFTDGCFYLLHLTIGNYAGQYGSPEISEEYRSLSAKLHLDTCLKDFSGPAHAWVIDEAYGLCKFVIVHGDRERLSAGRLRLLLAQHLNARLAGFPYLLLLYPEALSYHDIWNTAKELRQTAWQYSCPFVQEAWLSDEISAARTPGTADLAQALSTLRGLSSGASFLQLVHKTTEELLDQGYPSRLLMKFVSEVFSTAEASFLADPASCRSAAASIYGEFYCCPDKTAFTQTLSKRLETLLKEDSISLPGENLCGKITQYIGKHYCSRLSLNDLAEHFGYTASYINRIFKKELGISPLQYITNLKIEKAKELLQAETAMDIRDVAAAIGYEDARYFSRVFKNETGMTPTAFLTAGREP